MRWMDGWQTVCNKRDNNKIAFEQFFHQTSPSFTDLFVKEKNDIIVVN